MSKLILVTGGCGYIGSHTIVDLIEHGFEVISVDNLSRSSEESLAGVKRITGKAVRNYNIDLCDKEKLKQVFEQHSIGGIIHFAAYKTVPESVEKPITYYRNNLNSLLNILDLMGEHQVPHLIYSSSCSVYGNISELPVTESTPLAEAVSPYGNTKKIGEDMVRDFAKVTKLNCIALRYFNPIGAHPSAEIGEIPYGPPENLIPIITDTAKGIRDQLYVYGDDYNTRDGSCVRDYIHVMDIANAHTKALNYLINQNNKRRYEVFNIGSGDGVSVLEMLAAFEESTGQKVNFEIGQRRSGDVEAVYADNEKAKELLNWEPQYSLQDMMLSAWKWSLKIEEK